MLRPIYAAIIMAIIIIIITAIIASTTIIDDISHEAWTRCSQLSFRIPTLQLFPFKVMEITCHFSPQQRKMVSEKPSTVILTRLLS